jgi:nicotinamidase-related amidase
MQRLLILILTLFFTSFAFADTSVVIIDMQYGFYNDTGVGKTKELNDLISAQLKLIQWARARKMPVLLFEFEGKGKTDQKILNALAGHNFKVVQKTTDDGFSSYNKNLAGTLSTLKNWKIKKLIVSGINGGSCVHDSIQGASVHGFVSHTTGEIVGDLTVNPPVYPDSEWFFNHWSLKTYPTLKALQSSFP